MYCYCGATAEAMHTLSHAVEAGLLDWMWLERCPLLHSLRKEPRWPALRALVQQRATAGHQALGWPVSPSK